MENPDSSTKEFLSKAPLSSLNLFPCSQEAQGEQGGSWLTISKHCCPNSCRNSTAVSSPLEYWRERLFSPPDSAACWMVPAGMQLWASQSARRTAEKPGKSISRTGKSAWNHSEVNTWPSTVRMTCWTGVIEPAQREEFAGPGAG